MIWLLLLIIYDFIQFVALFVGINKVFDWLRDIWLPYKVYSEPIEDIEDYVLQWGNDLSRKDEDESY